MAGSPSTSEEEEEVTLTGFRERCLTRNGEAFLFYGAAMNTQEKVNTARSLLQLGVTRAKDLQDHLQLDGMKFTRVMHAAGAKVEKKGHHGTEQWWEWSFDTNPPSVKKEIPALHNERLHETIRIWASDGLVKLPQFDQRLQEAFGLKVSNVARLLKRAGLHPQQVKGKNHGGWEWFLAQEVTYEQANAS